MINQCMHNLACYVRRYYHPLDYKLLQETKQILLQLYMHTCTYIPTAYIYHLL